MRTCSTCGKPIISEGYVLDESYYCSGECLNGKDKEKAKWNTWETIELNTYDNEVVEFNIAELKRAVEEEELGKLEDILKNYTYDTATVLEDAIGMMRGNDLGLEFEKLDRLARAGSTTKGKLIDFINWFNDSGSSDITQDSDYTLLDLMKMTEACLENLPRWKEIKNLDVVFRAIKYINDFNYEEAYALRRR